MTLKITRVNDVNMCVVLCQPPFHRVVCFWIIQCLLCDVFFQATCRTHLLQPTGPASLHHSKNIATKVIDRHSKRGRFRYWVRILPLCIFRVMTLILMHFVLRGINWSIKTTISQTWIELLLLFLQYEYTASMFHSVFAFEVYRCCCFSSHCYFPALIRVHVHVL